MTMMQIQPTPGPWTVAGESGNDGEAEIIESPTRTIGWTANSLADDGTEQITGEDRANGRLFAASREMLAALRSIAERAKAMAETPGVSDRQHWHTVQRDAERAIAKAGCGA